jgi:lysophospholipase L1-like esterase
LFSHCKKPQQVVDPLPPPTPPSPVAKTYLALGDSYTIGQNVPVLERFPLQTTQWLVSNGVNMTATNIIATTGWTTSNLLSALSSQNPVPHDVVSLLIGVNDQYQQWDTTGYRGRFTQLLEKSIVLAKGLNNHVFVLSIPDYSVTPFASYGDTLQISRQIDQFNAINKEVTSKYQCNYLDITPSTREAKNNPTLLANDGLHPSGLEYKRWAEKLGPLMLSVLK